MLILTAHGRFIKINSLPDESELSSITIPIFSKKNRSLEINEDFSLNIFSENLSSYNTVDNTLEYSVNVSPENKNFWDNSKIAVSSILTELAYFKTGGTFSGESFVSENKNIIPSSKLKRKVLGKW